MFFLVPKPTPILQIPIPTIPIKSLSASGTLRSSNQLGLGGQLWAGLGEECQVAIVAGLGRYGAA